ncbi:MAG TPA: DUF433 domain-containing protein [Stellaceae bacterium]|nr:DUF433 domain-containing protein [Stellaceae bacterium]
MTGPVSIYNPDGRHYQCCLMATPEPIIHSDPEILGGTPVFVGTRVPLRNLLDYLEGGYTLDQFLDEFPSVTRERAVAALEAACEMLAAHAHSVG